MDELVAGEPLPLLLEAGAATSQRVGPRQLGDALLDKVALLPLVTPSVRTQADDQVGEGVEVGSQSRLGPSGQSLLKP